MSSLIPVIVGIATGIGLFVIFAAHFNETSSLSPSSYNSNLARIAALYSADCFDGKCATDMVLNCKHFGSAVVPTWNNRGLVILTEKHQQFCDIFVLDTNLEADGFGDDFIAYDCGINYVELTELKGRSFNELFGPDWPDPRWTCLVYSS